jgi:hypothetical protein
MGTDEEGMPVRPFCGMEGMYKLYMHVPGFLIPTPSPSKRKKHGSPAVPLWNSGGGGGTPSWLVSHGEAQRWEEARPMNDIFADQRGFFSFVHKKFLFLLVEKFYFYSLIYLYVQNITSITCVVMATSI